MWIPTLICDSRGQRRERAGEVGATVLRPRWVMEFIRAPKVVIPVHQARSRAEFQELLQVYLARTLAAKATPFPAERLIIYHS